MAIIPTLFRYEISNLILNNTRNDETEARIMAFNFIQTIPLTIDFKTPVYTELVQLATAAQLSAYDAVYLELAMRAKAPLATYDKKLAKAAKRFGIEVLG